MNNDKKTIFDEETTKEMLNKFDKINLGNISDDGIILYQEEALNEDTLYSTNRDSYVILMHLSSEWGPGFAGDPYIKVCKGKNFKQSGSIIRVSLKTGKAVIHNTPGKEKLTLNSEVRKWIIETLNKNSTDSKFLDMTVYDAAWKLIQDYAKPYPDIELAKKIPYEEFVKRFKANN